MRRLTSKEVIDQYGGKLPTDATLRADDEPSPAATPTPPDRRPRSDRFASLNAFIDLSLVELTGAEAKVWLILFRDTKAATGAARTGQADIGRRAGLTPRGVRKALACLQAKGLVKVVRRGRLNSGPSTYRIFPTAATP